MQLNLQRQRIRSETALHKKNFLLLLALDMGILDMEELTVPLFMGESGTVLSSSGGLTVVSLRGYAT